MDKDKYIKQYKKENYTTLRADFKKDDAAELKQYCKDMNISISKFIQLCCKYCIDHDMMQELKNNN